MTWEACTTAPYARDTLSDKEAKTNCPRCNARLTEAQAAAKWMEECSNPAIKKRQKTVRNPSTGANESHQQVLVFTREHLVAEDIREDAQVLNKSTRTKAQTPFERCHASNLLASDCCCLGNLVSLGKLRANGIGIHLYLCISQAPRAEIVAELETQMKTVFASMTFDDPIFNNETSTGFKPRKAGSGRLGARWGGVRSLGFSDVASGLGLFVGHAWRARAKVVPLPGQAQGGVQEGKRCANSQRGGAESANACEAGLQAEGHQQFKKTHDLVVHCVRPFVHSIGMGNRRCFLPLQLGPTGNTTVYMCTQSRLLREVLAAEAEATFTQCMTVLDAKDENERFVKMLEHLQLRRNILQKSLDGKCSVDDFKETFMQDTFLARSVAEIIEKHHHEAPTDEAAREQDGDACTQEIQAKDVVLPFHVLGSETFFSSTSTHGDLKHQGVLADMALKVLKMVVLTVRRSCKEYSGVLTAQSKAQAQMAAKASKLQEKLDKQLGKDKDKPKAEFAGPHLFQFLAGHDGYNSVNKKTFEPRTNIRICTTPVHLEELVLEEAFIYRCATSTQALEVLLDGADESIDSPEAFLNAVSAANDLFLKDQKRKGAPAKSQTVLPRRARKRPQPS